MSPTRIIGQRRKPDGWFGSGARWERYFRHVRRARAFAGPDGQLWEPTTAGGWRLIPLERERALEMEDTGYAR